MATLGLRKEYQQTGKVDKSRAGKSVGKIDHGQPVPNSNTLSRVRIPEPTSDTRKTL